jgi:hypothetical protein
MKNSLIHKAKPAIFMAGLAFKLIAFINHGFSLR